MATIKYTVRWAIPVGNPFFIDGGKVKRALEDNGLQGLVCGVFGPTQDLTADDVSLHENCFRYAERYFELCNAWDAEFSAGPMYSAEDQDEFASEGLSFLKETFK